MVDINYVMDITKGMVDTGVHNLFSASILDFQISRLLFDSHDLISDVIVICTRAVSNAMLTAMQCSLSIDNRHTLHLGAGTS